MWKLTAKITSITVVLSLIVTQICVWLLTPEIQPKSIYEIENDSLKKVVLVLSIKNGKNELIIDNIRKKDSLIVIKASKNLKINE